MDLDTWLATCATELEIEDFRWTNETMHTLLDLARDSAHHVARVSAPLTTFLVGVAVGRGASLERPLPRPLRCWSTISRARHRRELA